MQQPSEMTDVELKAAAYERVCNINANQHDLQLIEDELRRRMEKPVEKQEKKVK